MDTELIRAVYVKSDGVYLNSKSNNDDLPFRDWKCESLTKIYQNEGQHGLDREMVRMFYEYANIQGHHPSVERYRPCLRDGKAHVEAFVQTATLELAKLPPEEAKTILLPEEKQTDGAKAYKKFRRDKENELYSELAHLAGTSAEKKPRHKSDFLR